MALCVQVTQLVEFLIEHARELLEEEVPGLARAPGDGSPALQLEAEAAEVPPVAAHTKHPKTSCQERRLPGSSQASRKRKPACEEGSNGQPERKHRRLEREVSWTGSLGNPSRSPFNFSAWIPCINSGAWASSTTSVEARREAPMSSCSVQPISLLQPVIIFSAPATKENTRGSLQPLSLLRRRQRKEEKREQERRNSSKRK
ncbi:PREDICTED: uncharacterized protein LOC106897560 [Calidris pugnax]|uniref:uncharacterized protein LOC106897560 n=1 Tax=Calidris pugnax TaxID=198806 RepID=UPI00071D1543|nr:PREDICTED: uncharacterized protein LOC106897560 [Calidris pugnax]